MLTVRKLFDGRTYYLDSFQRDYAWEIVQVEKLVDDLAAKFTAQWYETHLEEDTKLYDPYFLGSIIIYRQNGRIYLADGQQRVITLLLMLIRLGTLTEYRHDAGHLHAAVRLLMRGEDHGGQHFAVRVDRYAEFFDQLANDRPFTSDGVPADVRRLHEAAEHLLTRWPEDLKQDALPYFARWLLDRVSLVELDAGDATRGKEMFSAMNDRGKHLAPLDLLKNYLLADAPGDPYQLDLRWQHMVDKLHGPDRDAPLEFVRAVVRAKYVTPAADASQLLESAPHEWLHENAETIGQNRKRDGRVRLFTDVFEPLSRPYVAMLEATSQLRPGQEAIWYNTYHRIPRQFDLALAAAEPNEPEPSVLRKAELVARFLDLFVVTRGVRQLPYGPSELDELVSALLGRVRMTRTADELGHVLGEAAAGWYVHLVEMPELRYLQGGNRSFVLYLLARLTVWLAGGTGHSENVEHLLAVAQGRRPFEVEHLFTKSSGAGTYAAQATSATDFERMRSRLGGLVLLDGSDNASVGGLPLERKLASYLRSNVLAGSLHPDIYRSRGHKRFSTFIAEQGLTELFRPYDVGDPPEAVVNARGRLYRAMAERIWSPESLGLPLSSSTRSPVTAVGNDRGDGGRDVDDDAPRRRQRYNVTLKELIDAGLLRADERLVGRRDGQMFPATLTADGRIRTASGKIHRSLSAAAKAATGAPNPGDWRFWRVERTDDTLFATRARYLLSSGVGQNG
ncbi:DUF262 domain-containing protein [Frankia sp. CNm7]|uniref:DUF262 domain-containing protein n=1 Tax=Frankia nepalensis TaxID=1836974 RepID=A0A937REJ2_9ACTN|nr:DUF262 domain-containing protein [Frankia nepalensis]MBL7496547.1 DUF262 domain-containing protein [Frankia nepalensis]MBL7508766.1 DUF262 domain-containing protein [Frankia nepalensis]MBL7520607.1 DUF262 domain-containing protein [Frankia nepalensis]MBL7627520.1 DUF262 domain-containing protein [Frankia nepalensis]